MDIYRMTFQDKNKLYLVLLQDNKHSLTQIVLDAGM